jgi:glycosyltransferase involved in cell wall biosynthesis
MVIESPSLQPLRIEMTLPTLAAAGMETVVARLAIRLAARGHNVGVTCLEDGGPLAAQLTSGGVDVAVVPTPGLVTNLRAPLLEARFASRALDVLHTHSGTWLKAARAAHRAGVRRIIHTVHGLHDREPRFSRLLVRAASHYTHAITAVSLPLLEYMKVRHGAPQSSMIIANGIDLTRFAPTRPGARGDRETRRRSLGVPADGMLIGHIARLAPVKNQSLLLQAFQRVAEQRPEARLVVLGDGPLKEQLDGQARALGIDDKVRFVGAVADVAPWLSAFDVFVLSSDAEGTSISILEALASGLCVVATAVGGNVELLDRGAAGILVPRGERDALAQALLRVVRDENIRAMLGAAGRAHVERWYSEEAMVDAYERLYRGNAAMPADQ